MQIKNNKQLKISAVASIISVGLIFGTYSMLNKDVVLVVKGEERNISTFKSNVGELLEEQNVKYDSNDIVTASLDSKIKNNMNIEVIDVVEKSVIESKKVPFEVEVIEDKNIPKGETKVEVEGKSGENELVYTITYHNEKQVDKKFVEELVAINPEKKIIKKGSKVEEVKVASSRGGISRGNATTLSTSTNNLSTNKKAMKVVATAYTGDSVTSTGTKPKWGTIAVDPSIIPYGTKVFIPQFNMTFIAEDTGSAIKGNKIDIFMNDESAVYNWGIKNIDIYIVG
ncbi:MAG: 3D domain-containing protein [Romboutsia sp.]